MESVEALVAHMQGLSGSPEEISHLHELLKQAEDCLRSQASHLAPFLDQLDPSKQSIGYLYFLEAFTATTSIGDKASDLAKTVADFISSCSAEQIRLVPNKFTTVCKRFRDVIMQLQMPMRGIAPLRIALRKLQPSSEHLTTLHPDFLLLCLLAKCYKTGFSILEEDIFEIDLPRDFFLYCYYGGMICIGEKHFRKAMELLHNVVTAPTSTANAIAIEAHKKFILVSLIQNGQFTTVLPKYLSSLAQRNLRNYCQAYYDLANAYSTGKISEVETSVAANKENFESDKNLGLVKQVVTSLYKRNIQRLTQTYLTLSLQDIANRVQLSSSKEAEMHVLQMIQDGEIFASINQKDGMVRFLEDPEQYKTCEMIEHIDSSIQRVMSLSKKLTAVDEYMSCDTAYVGKAGRERQRFELDDFDTVPHKIKFTPSRGSISTNHRISFTESPRVSQSNFMDIAKGGTFPGDKKKKLAELLKESLGGDEDYYLSHNNKKQETKPSSLPVLPKSTNGSPFMSKSNSVRSSETTPSRYYKSEKEKSGKNSQCCLPSLVTSLSFKERKKKLSPSRHGEV